MKIASKTLIDQYGRIILYSIDDFVEEIVNRKHCFICGAKPGSKVFNDEHILPDWILRKYNLFHKTIGLPNNALYQYGQYKVPCCLECNEELGKIVEKPVSKLLKLSYDEIVEKLKDWNYMFLLFKWLNLVFFKTHLRDTTFKYHLDARKGNENIGEMHHWEAMHHVHCIVRSHYTGAIVHPKTLGSIFILPAFQHESIDTFDFMDNGYAKGILLRLDGFCVLCILDDCSGTASIVGSMIRKLNGPLTQLQLREVFAHLVYVSIHLKEKAKLYSQFTDNGDYFIKAKFPEWAEIDTENTIITPSELLHHYSKDLVAHIEDREQMLCEIKEGKRGFLLDINGNFVNHSENLDSFKNY